MTKICKVCKREKDICDFYIDRRHGTPHLLCKKCENQKGYASLKKNPERYIRSTTQHRINASLKRREMAEKVDQIKKEKGCYICGYKAFVVSLSFHHLDPSIKKKEISNLVNGGPSRQKELDAEMAKCIILCRNCHFALHGGFIQLPKL